MVHQDALNQLGREIPTVKFSSHVSDRLLAKLRRATAVFMVPAIFVVGCVGAHPLPEASPGADRVSAPDYLIGPGDNIQIFVWGSPELSVQVPVRPDGHVSTPLVEDLMASGRTPTQLARDIEKALEPYIKDTVVTVMVNQFAGPYSQQIRVIGEATRPQALPYREHMTVLDVMIAVGGLTQFAAGNKATIVREADGVRQQLRVRLDDLVKDGDIGANVEMLPGDILIVPESWF